MKVISRATNLDSYICELLAGCWWGTLHQKGRSLTKIFWQFDLSDEQILFQPRRKWRWSLIQQIWINLLQFFCIRDHFYFLQRESESDLPCNKHGITHMWAVGWLVIQGESKCWLPGFEVCNCLEWNKFFSWISFFNGFCVFCIKVKVLLSLLSIVDQIGFLWKLFMQQIVYKN